MRTIQRDVVGAFIFSSDGKVLLGYSGVYEGSLSVPGGGINPGETRLAALKREVLEETGIDITEADMKEITSSSGESEKTLRGTKERVFVKMKFYNYLITLNTSAEETKLLLDDDFTNAGWFTQEELEGARIAPGTSESLIELGFITS